MKYLLYFILLIATSSQVEPQQHNHTIYHLVPDYATYHKLFSQNAGPKNTVEMTEYGTGIELCEQMKVCRFYVYLHEPADSSKIKYTVLMTAGIHGNELLGPTSLLYLYPLLKPEDIRIIYFPILNPSGYDRKTRLTFPNEVDLNRDYPIDCNTKCYQGSATRILDKIFRKYRIDLTINLHNGGDEISWNWGTIVHKNFPRTDDYPIYSSIGTMLQFVGGWNQKLKINPFKIGTMNQVIYPAEGTLDDWAYAGSWVQDCPVYKCEHYNFDPYPKQMHQGLVFLFELGRHNASENMLGTSEGLKQPSDSNKISNGYIPRTLRMLMELVKVVSPVLEFEWVGSKLKLKLQGCSKLQSLSVTILNSNTQQQLEKVQIALQKIAQINNMFTHVGQISLQGEEIRKENNITINYKYECSKQWLGKGKTFLAKERVFQGTLVIPQRARSTPDFNSSPTSEKKAYWGLAIIPIFLFGLFIHRLFIRRKPVGKASTKIRSSEPQMVQTDSSLKFENDECVEVEIETSQAN